MTCERTERLVHAHSGTPQCWGGLARIGERSALGRLEANHSSSGVDVTLPRETCNRNRGFVRPHTVALQMTCLMIVSF